MATQQNTGNLAHVAERGATAIDRLMMEQFDISLSLDEMQELRDEIRRICTYAIAADQE